MRMTEQRAYVLLAVGLAIGGLFAALLARKKLRDSLRERGRHGLKLVKERADRLRTAAEEIAKRAREFVGPQCNSIETDSEAEKQDYQEEKRSILGG